MNPWRDLSPLLNPAAMAVVGASERQGSAGRLVLENLHQLAYRGAVLLGAEKVLPTLEMAVEIGARATLVLASGFGEAGPEGEARQAEWFASPKRQACWCAGLTALAWPTWWTRWRYIAWRLARRRLSRAGQCGAIWLSLPHFEQQRGRLGQR